MAISHVSLGQAVEVGSICDAAHILAHVTCIYGDQGMLLCLDEMHDILLQQLVDAVLHAHTTDHEAVLLHHVTPDSMC